MVEDRPGDICISGTAQSCCKICFLRMRDGAFLSGLPVTVTLTGIPGMHNTILRYFGP